MHLTYARGRHGSYPTGSDRLRESESLHGINDLEEQKGIPLALKRDSKLVPSCHVGCRCGVGQSLDSHVLRHP